MPSYEKQNPESISALFDDIAPRYDAGNALLSCNLHRLWNQRLVDGVQARANPKRLLDLCCGTGEIAGRFQKMDAGIECYLVDFSSEMLDLAKKRLNGAQFHFIQADATALPLDLPLFDAVTVAYGIRNIEKMSLCFDEIFRAMKSGATLGIAELTRPSNSFLASLHRLYLRCMVPLLGKIATNNKDAYTYLCKSIENFIPAQEIASALKKAGFTSVEIRPQTFGIATLVFAKKP